jgi:tetratricopeptide (TPR) repeat protein
LKNGVPVFLRKLLRFVPRGPLGRALGAANRGDFGAAAALFEEVLAAHPEPPADVLLRACETWVEIARRREAAGDLGEAVQALERAARLRPRYADVQVHLGRLYVKLDRIQHAREAFQRALAINPRYFEARLALARLLMRLEDRGAALEQLQEAAHSGPEYAAGPLQELLHALPTAAEHGGGRHRLEELFDRLLAGPPSPVAAALEVVRAALRDGDNGLAIAELKKLLRLHPRFPDLHNLLGVAYDNEEMTDDAIEEFEQALRLNPSYLDAQLNLGLALFERGRDAEAERLLRQVAAHPGGNEVARSVLAQIEARSAAR